MINEAGIYLNSVFVLTINSRSHRPILCHPVTLPAKVMSRAFHQSMRGRGAIPANRMPGRIIDWDLEAELNQIQQEGPQDGLQQGDPQGGLQQEDQQMPWQARPPVPQQLAAREQPRNQAQPQPQAPRPRPIQRGPQVPANVAQRPQAVRQPRQTVERF